MPIVVCAAHKSQQECQVVLKVRHRDGQHFTITDKYTIRQHIENTNVPKRASVDVVTVQPTILIINLVSVEALAR